MPIFKKDILTAIKKLTELDGLDDTLYAFQFCGPDQFDKMFSPDFNEILPFFFGKSVALFVAFLKNISRLFKDNDSIELARLSFKNKDIHELDLSHSKEALICLEINITDWEAKDFESFLQKIAGIPIHRIEIQGVPKEIVDPIVKNFLEDLYNVDFVIRVNYEKTSQKKRRSMISPVAHYRNILLKQLDIKPGADFWSPLMENWMALDDTLDELHYLKLVHPLDGRKEVSAHEESKQLALADTKKAVAQYLKDLEQLYQPTPSDHSQSVDRPVTRSLMDAYVSALGSEFLKKMLETKPLPSAKGFHFNTPLTKRYIEQLTNYVDQQGAKIFFSQLWLKITDKEIVASKEFAKLLQALQKTNSIEALHLVLEGPALLDCKLMDNVLPYVDYPIVIRNAATKDLKSRVSTPLDFQKEVIKKIQKKNIQRLKEQDVKIESKLVLDQKAEAPYYSSGRHNKIKLKDLLPWNSGGTRDRFSLNYVPPPEKIDPTLIEKHIKLEVQYVQVEQQQQQQQISVIKQIINPDVADHSETEVHQSYEGELISWDQFSGPPYSSIISIANRPARLIDFLKNAKEELFWLFPMSPAAAMEIAKNAPAYSALNLTNLPQFFIRKKTKKGLWVLDYDLDEQDRKCNVFTPKAFVPHDQDHVYTVSLEEKNVKRWVPDHLYKKVCLDKKTEKFSPKKLLKLWTKFGDEGIEEFFKQLTACDRIHEGFSLFLYDHYLQHFLHWDHFLDNQEFFDCLKKIKTYSPIQLNCLKRFLENTGPSKHDLKHTLAAFESFWTEVQAMCQKQHVPINKLDTHWRTPPNGNPAVYMDRLLTILKNARNLKEQMECLDGIVLNRYGAYHASQYEGFKVVSKEMDFSTSTAYRDDKAFDPELPWYRVQLTELQGNLEVREIDSRIWVPQDYTDNPTWLIDGPSTTITPEKLEKLKEEKKAFILTDRKQFKPPYKLYWRDDKETDLRFHHFPLSFAKFLTLVYRFIGQQSHGIKIKDYVAGATDQYFKYQLNSVLLLSLFFVAHERYEEEINLVGFLNSLGIVASNEITQKPVLENLMELYAVGTYLSDLEGDKLIDRLGQMNSDEFESEYGFGCGKNKIDYSLKIFNHLKTNKYGTLKMISFLCQRAPSKWPFIYAIDTADHFATDRAIAVTYKDDLLLFSTLINKWPDLYHNKTKQKGLLDKVEKVKAYLHDAAVGPAPNNLDYAFKLLFQSKNFFTWDDCIAILKQVAALGDNAPRKVDKIILSNPAIPFTLSKAPPIFTRDDSDIRNIMIDIVTVSAPALAEEKDPETKEAAQNKKDLRERELFSMDFARLQTEASVACRQNQDASQIKLLLNRLKDAAIENKFNTISSPAAKAVCEHVKKMLLFSNPSFEKIAFITTEIKKIVDLFNTICLRKNFSTNEKQFTELFKKFAFWKLDYNQFYALLELLNTMPQRNYFEIIQALFYEGEVLGNLEKYQALLGYINLLDRNHFNSDHIVKIIQLFNHSQYKNIEFKKIHELFDGIIKDLIDIFKENPKDPLLHTLLTTSGSGDAHCLQRCLTLTKNITVSKNRLAAAKLLNALHKSQPPELQPFLLRLGGTEEKAGFSLDSKNHAAQKILEIIAQSYHSTTVKKIKTEQFCYTDLIKELELLRPAELTLLHKFIQKSALQVNCLCDQIKYYNASDKTNNFEHFLLAVEKAPFGARPFDEHFACTEVERVINQSCDLNNESKYTYAYRKQLMEAFLFVNEAGRNLAIYPAEQGKKPAKDLSNEEIQAAFRAIRAGTLDHLTSFQQGLYALGLMREAMYRATGQFPYSTQIIALIDCLMADGHVISNIDTGQGKSWIDTMKAVLLWSQKGCKRVDITTSSVVDAKRDIERNSTFLDLLDIPYSDEVITAQTDFDKYKLDGLNYSTFPHLSLFRSKALLKKGAMLGSSKDKVGLVINESDHDILDERTIYRLASPNMGHGKEWIYEAINAFISSPIFRQGNQTEEGDVASLKEFLQNYAALHDKSANFIKKLKYEQLLTWIESALIAKYHLREKTHYIIPKEPEKKEINQVTRLTAVTKILNQDRRVEPEMTYGNGMQQLLYVHLNEQKRSHHAFVIEPENKTIISTNNKNLIDSYIETGIIWGSSATVGSSDEVRDQYQKYGFEFSKIEPHQKSQVIKNELNILPDETKQFEFIKTRLLDLYDQDAKKVMLVFFKDIQTVERFQTSIEFDRRFNHLYGQMQVYLGIGDEEEIIEQAGRPGKSTLTTSALGRNTDIPYGREKGMTVIQTFPDSIRGTNQKGGRTGRAGSPGTVEYIYNEQDFEQEIDLSRFKASPDHKTISEREFNERLLAAFQASLEKKAADQRQSNEELYDILQSLLKEIESFSNTDFYQGTKEDFLTNQWSAFSEKTELDYKLSRSENRYDQGDFRRRKLQAFDHLLKKYVRPTARIEKKEHRPLPLLKYVPWQPPVKISDCISPAMISYYFLKEEKSALDVKLENNVMEEKLKTILDAIKCGETHQCHQDYFDYLNSNAAHLIQIRAFHKSYLTDFLKKESEVINQAGFMQRWFGSPSQLNHIANDRQYILLFSALSHVQQGSLVGPKELGNIIIALLQEYLDQSWFINAIRKQTIENLISDIKTIEETSVLINTLTASKLKMLEHDINLNKGPCPYWRQIKRINFFGESRFQQTIGSAIRLASATVGANHDDKLIDTLGDKLKSVTTSDCKGEGPVNTFLQSKSKDHFMNAATFLRHSRRAAITDKGNMKVVLKSLDDAFEAGAPEILTAKKRR